MHARSSTDGFLAHTYTLGPEFRINGADINETQIVALSAEPYSSLVLDPWLEP